MAVKYTHPRGTRSNLNSLASGNALTVGQLYYILDENRIAVATAVNAFTVFSNETDANNASNLSSGTVPSARLSGTYNITNSGSSATLTTGRTIAMTGDVSWTSPSFNGSGNVTAAGTLATVNSNVGSFGSSAQTASFTVNAKGLITAASNVTITPHWTNVQSKPTTLSGYSVAASDVLSTVLTVDGAGSGLDADLLDGQHGSYYLSASNLNGGTVPDARLSGIYSGIGVKLTGTNTIFGEPNTGTQSSTARTVTDLISYRNSGSAATGAIVFIAPNTLASIMHRLKIEGMIYTGAPTVCAIVQGYKTTTWGQTSKINLGITDIQVRFGQTADGKSCVILGDVGTTWSYTHIAITHAMFSHGSVADSYCYGWTSALVTDLSSYTNVTSTIANTWGFDGTDLKVGSDKVWDAGNDGSGSGLDADLLDGSQRDTAYNSFGNNTIPVRHASGYLFSNYFNMTANTSTGTATKIAIENSGDGYLRWQTPAQFITNHSISTVGHTHAATDITSGTIADARLSGTYTGVAITGNAGTATTLATTRSIWGQNFNGSGSVSGDLTGVGNITGSSAITISASGTNQPITLTPTGTGTVNGPTFNATSTTNGGFQGIDADTAAVPSFTWSADLNTGMWHAGTDQIGFTTGGTNRLTLSTTALTSTLGITAPTFTGAVTGNASTATTLQTARTIGGVSFNGSANINLPGVNAAGNQNTSGSAATLTTGRTIAMTGDVTWNSGSFNGSGNVTAAGTLATVNSNVGSFGSNAAVPIITVNAKGLVTAVSTTPLGTAAIQTIGTIGGVVPLLNAQNTWSKGQILYSDTVSDSWTNFGFQIREVNLVGAAQSSNAYAPSISFHWSGRDVRRLLMNSTGSLRWDAEPIWYNGNIPTGAWTATTDGIQRFHFTASSHSFYKTAAAHIFYNSSNTTIGTLDASGNWTVPGDITAYSSDERLKENVRSIEDPLDKIDQIGGYLFDWRKEVVDELGFTPHQYEDEHGFLAQEIQKVMPDAVRPAPFNPDYLTVKYERVIPLAIEGIKALKRENEELRKALISLTDRLEAKGLI